MAVTAKRPAAMLVFSGALLLAYAMLASDSALARNTGATKNAAQEDGTLVFTQNMGEARVLFVDPVTRTQIVNFQLGEVLRECRDQAGNQLCFVIGGHHSVINDHDYVEVASFKTTNAFGTVARISLKEPKRPVWRLNRLDFSNVPSNGSCTASCDDGRIPPVGCSLQLVHEVVIADENPQEQWVELILAEMFNLRVTKVRLDYRNGNTCGEVQWVIDSSHPDWPPNMPMVNGVQLVDGPEGHFLITTLLTEDSTLQAGGGRILMWDMDSGEPELLWKFPADGDTDRPFLNAVHHGLIETDPLTGQRYLLYGHSLGDSEIWNSGSGGAWGIAAIDNLRQTPTYLGDWVLPREHEELRFTRELEILPNGSFFGVDAGCYTGDSINGCPGALYWFEPTALPFTDLPGWYSPDHQMQNIVPLNAGEITDELRCGFDLLFEADVLEEEMIGRELRAAMAEGGSPCPDY